MKRKNTKMTEIKDIIAQRQAENPAIIEAYDLQCEIERKEAELNELKEAYRAKLDAITANDIRGRFFNVTELRPYREVNVTELRERYPDAYENCKTISNADIIGILESAEPNGKRGLIERIAENFPAAFNKCVKVNIGDIEKFLGKKQTKTLEGTGCIRTTYKAGKATKILYIGDKLATPAAETEIKAIPAKN